MNAKNAKNLQDVEMASSLGLVFYLSIPTLSQVVKEAKEMQRTYLLCSWSPPFHLCLNGTDYRLIMRISWTSLVHSQERKI